MSGTCGLVIVLVLDRVVSTSARRSTSPTVDPIAGVLSLIVAAALWRRRSHEGPTGRPGQQVPRRGDGCDGAQRGSGVDSSAAIEGAGARLAEGRLRGWIWCSTYPASIWYLVAINDIAAADYRPAVAVLLIVIFNAIMFLLAEVPLIGYLVRPDQTTVRVNRIQAWLSDNRQFVAAVAAVVVGLYVISRAVSATP